MSETALTVPKSAAPEVSSEEMDTLASELGLVGLPKSMVNRLVRLGIGLKENGLVPYANGMVLATSSAMWDVMQLIHKKIKSPKRTVDEVRALSYALGYLARNTQQNLNSTIKQENTQQAVEQEADKRRRRSFVPHATVLPSVQAQNVQIVNNFPAQSGEQKMIDVGLKKD